MPRLRLAIIGLGTAVQPHARALIDLAGSIEVVAAVTRSAARAAAFAQNFPFPVTLGMDEVIADPAIDAILLLTPPNAHLDLAERCLGAGKHVLVEKPLELTGARAARIVAAARAADRVLGVVLQNRFRPAVLRLGELIAAGELGAVVSASVQVPWWRPQSYYDEPGRGTYARDGGGVLITQAIHALDVFRALVGVSKVEAAQVATSALHAMEGEDQVTALVRLGNGAPGSIMATTAAFPGRPEVIDVICERATARLEGAALRVNWHDGRTERAGEEGGGGSGANVMDFPHDMHRALIADFAQAVASAADPQTRRAPRVSGEEALATQRLIEDILAADPSWRGPAVRQCNSGSASV